MKRPDPPLTPGLIPRREPQPITVDQFFDPGLGLPEKTELVDGMIGPFSDDGIRNLIANWGVDRVIAATGRDVWRDALAAFGNDD